MNPLFQPIETAVTFNFSLYFLSSFLFLILSLTLVALLAKKNYLLLLQPANATAIIFIVIFQLPHLILNKFFEDNLTAPWLFGLSVSLIPPLLLTAKYLSDKVFTPEQRLNTSLPPKNDMILSFLTAEISLVLLIAYFQRIPISCTGLYTLIFDPQMTLIAREISVKFLGTKIPTLAYGALVNVLAPLSMLLLYSNISRAHSKKAVCIVAAATAFILALIGTLAPGAKGALLPTMVAMSFMLFASKENLPKKIFNSVVLSTGILLAFLTLELAKTSTETNRNFNFGYCAKTLGSCDSAYNLLDSLKSRDRSLGAPNTKLAEASKSLAEHCGTEEVAFGPDAPVKSGSICQSFSCYLLPIIYRAFVIPIQVASWYFEHSSQSGRAGFAATPLGKINGDFINMPEKIHSEYATLFSQGAKVSTGTSPTSFLMAYPSYLGWLGLALALVLVIGFDFATKIALRNAAAPIYYIGLSLFSVAVINFMLSDFFTVLSSHGAFSSLIVVTLYTFISKEKSIDR